LARALGFAQTMLGAVGGRFGLALGARLTFAGNAQIDDFAHDAAASSSASTKRRIALDSPPVRAASISVINPATLTPRRAASRSNAFQNSGSRLIEVG
jgi:hypothetical protein